MNELIEIQLGETSNDTVTVSYQSSCDSTLEQSPNGKVESRLNESEMDNSDSTCMPSYKKLTIKKGQYISDILTEIPTNTIIDKTITGCGMTTMEIEAKRHSIIIVPNTPIVTGKARKHEDVFGVLEGVFANHIIKYLETDTIMYKKFITTPESYYKIITVLERKKIDYFKDYFILFDECEKVIKDVDYRGDIINPFDTLFNFDGKALVSATPLPFSDPRFKSFTYLKINPDYDYRVDVHLRTTNNPRVVLFGYLNNHKEDCVPIFIFFNSIVGIRNCMTTFGIEKESNIYCSSEKKKELLKNEQCKNLNIYEDIYESKCYNKYNFMTSKFYSGVDIDLDFNPNVIFITDFCIGKHSLADPYSDIYQAHGRFRNGVKNFIHITGYDKELDVMSEDNLKLQLGEWGCAYKDIKSLAMSSNGQYYNHSINEVIIHHAFHPYMRDNRLNYFMIDCRFFKNYRNNCYINCWRIRVAYSNSKKFIVNYKYLRCPSSSKDEMIIFGNLADEITRNRQIIEVIAITKSNDKSEYYDKLLERLKDSDKFLIEASLILSRDELVATNYKSSMIKESVENKKKVNMCKSDILMIFKEGECYSNSVINDNLSNIYAKYSQPINKRGMTKDLEKYFKVSNVRTNGKRKTKIEKIL